MKLRFKILGIGCCLLMLSCHSEPSLQQFYVDHQNKPNFVVVDLPMSLIFSNLDTLPDTAQKTIRSIEKANVLALPLNGDNHAQYDTALKTLKQILSKSSYKLLLRLNFSDKHLQLRYLGEGDAIDEFVMFGYDDENGFIIVRLLGDNMKPKALVHLIGLMHGSRAKIGLEGLENMF